MSGSTAKIVPEINLDEFERRLRSAGAAQSGAEDPLAELTRLVNMISRENNKGDAVAELPQAHMPKAEGFPPAANDEPAARVESGASQAPHGEAEREQLETPPGLEAATAPSGAAESDDFSGEDHAAPLADVGEAEARKGRPRAWYFKTVGLAAIGVALLGGAAALKIGVVPGLPKRPPFIAAAEGPTKIQPPSDATVQSGGDSAALLMKDSATAAPVKVVSTEEQPVDLRAQTPTPTPVAAASPPATPNTPSPVAPAANTPVVPPAEASATVAPLFPEAKPVKTVSVRPDGTLISVDSPSPPLPPAPAAKSATRVADNSAAGTAAAAAAEPATPKLDLPTKLSPPKSSARVVAKTETTAPAAATDTTPNAPLQLGSPALASKPTKTPPAKVATAVADAAPADAAAATEPAGAGGGWAVQFAAPRSEADAQSAISRLKSKYADALGGAELAVRKADVNGQTIYRVRAGGLSKADAAALCAKMKASGGECFIAKN